MLDLFGNDMRGQLAAPLARLAADGIFLGTSSWAYPGWLGQIYDWERYSFRKKFSMERFRESCLGEFSETFKTACFDGAYYNFPEREWLETRFNQLPQDFRLSFKVTEAVTAKAFPNIARSGAKAGQVNPDYLNADLFTAEFLGRCEPFRAKIGVLMFEFSRFPSSEYREAGEFAADLDAFLSKLPKGWDYGVEIRNKEFLKPEYFSVLRRHGVPHVFNSWTAMPPVDEQMALPDAQTSDELIAARFLLKPGRNYETAVKEFSPYNSTKEVYEAARQAALALIKLVWERRKRRAFIYINNRLEGSALRTIAALLAWCEANRESAQRELGL